MATTNLKGNGQLRTGRIEIDVPYLGKTSTFVLPLIGPDYHEHVMGKIDSQKLYRPTTAEVLSLADLAFQNAGEPNCAEIINRFKKNYLWAGTESLSFPEGVLVYDNIDGKMPQTSKGLIKLLDAKDQRVRLVKPGFKTGSMSISEFLKHPYVIAQIGEKMIETAERVAKACHETEAYVFGLDRADSDTKRLTAVCSGWDGGRLFLDGDYGEGNNGGCASGVSKSAEGAAKI